MGQVCASDRAAEAKLYWQQSRMAKSARRRESVRLRASKIIMAISDGCFENPLLTITAKRDLTIGARDGEHQVLAFPYRTQWLEGSGGLG